MPCITLSSGKSVCFESNNYSDGGPVNKNNPIQHKGVDINAKPWMKDNDSWFENIAEFIDPTGITSWDDVRRAGNNYGYDSPEAMIEMAGAVPLLGKIGKSGKIISGGFGLLHDVVKGASYLPPKLQKKVIDVAYPMYQKYAKAGGKELDEALGYGSKLIRDNTPLLNPSKWGSSEKSIQGFNILQKLGRSKSAYDAATGSKDNTGFSGGFGSPEPLQFNGRNVLPDLQSEYRKGGKTLQVKGSSFNFPKSQQQILAEQARMQGDMPIAPAIANQQFRMMEEEALKKRLSKQPTVTINLSEAQKEDIADYKRRHGLLIEDVLAEQMMRNKQSLSNPDEGDYMDVLGNSVLKQIGFNPDVLGSAGHDIQDNGLLGLGNTMLSYPTGIISGRYETPSQAIGRFALRNDANQLRNAMIDDQGNPTGLGMATDIFGPMALGQILPKGADLAAKALGTEEGLLSNAYRINPNAVKNNPQMYLYRTETKNFPTKMLSEEENLKSIIEKGGLSPMQERMLKSKLSKIQNNPDADVAALNKYYGQWFDSDPSRMDWYMRGRLDGDEGNILRLKVPTKEGSSYNLKNFPDAQKASASIETEFIVPRDRKAQAEVFSTNDYQRLVDEDKAFNKPHWWKGFKKDGGFIKAEEGKKNKKANVKKPSANSNVFISPRNPIIPLTPVVSGGELADQSASRNNNARMRSTTPISRPVVVTPPRPQPQPQPPVTNEEGLLDQLNNSANQFRQFLSDAYDRSLNATGEAISDLGDNITELLTPDYPSAPIYNEPEPQKNTPNTPPKPETPKKDIPLSNMDKLKLQFIKDNNLNVSPDQIYLGSDDRGRQVFRLYNDKDPKIQSYRNQFEAADNDERGITERPGMQISKAISSNPGSAYCIATATGLICDQGFLNPELMKNKGRYWNPAVESYAKNNKYNLTYNKKVNPLEFKGEPNSILQFTSEGHPFHATVLSDVYYPLDELNNPHYVTYGNPGSSSSGVVKKIYTFSTPSKAEVEGEHYLDYPGGVPALIRSNYKKQNGGKNAKTITLSTGKVVTLK